MEFFCYHRDRPTQTGQRGYRCPGALAEVTVGLAGGHERQFANQHDQEPERRQGGDAPRRRARRWQSGLGG